MNKVDEVLEKLHYYNGGLEENYKKRISQAKAELRKIIEECNGEKRNPAEPIITITPDRVTKQWTKEIWINEGYNQHHTEVHTAIDKLFEE